MLKIEIPNWAKFNPRADRANYSWFRLENDFFSDQRVFLLSGNEQRLYLFVLCEASKKNEGIIELVPQYIAALLRISEQEVVEALTTLNHSGLIKADNLPSISRQEAVTEPTKSLTTKRNETNVTNDILPDLHPAKLDFESLYKKYPRKDGKKAGFRICKTRIKTPGDYAKLSLAIDRYREDLVRKETDPKFIKHFSTFMNAWEDWLDPAAGTTLAEIVAKKPEPIYSGRGQPTAESTAEYLRQKEIEYVRPADKEKVLSLIRSVSKGCS